MATAPTLLEGLYEQTELLEHNNRILSECLTSALVFLQEVTPLLNASQHADRLMEVTTAMVATARQVKFPK